MTTTTFIVEGTTFPKFTDSVNYAQEIAARDGRSVDIDCEIAHDVTKVERKWIAKMHPPGFQRPTLMDLSA